jgi:methionyl-tRNA formyltransferase
VHASLLPKYRGAAPINHAILNGEHVTGVTSFLLNDVVDTGTVIEQRRAPISDDMTAGELYEALMPLAADCAVSTVDMLLSGNCSPLAQNDAEATPAPKIYRETAVIDWTHSREHVRNIIRAYSPAPSAWTVWNGQVLKIYRASRSNEIVRPGEWSIIGQSLIAGCADGSLSLDEVQLPGKRRMPIADIVRGYRGLSNGSFSLLPSEHP